MTIYGKSPYLRVSVTCTPYMGFGFRAMVGTHESIVLVLLKSWDMGEHGRLPTVTWQIGPYDRLHLHVRRSYSFRCRYLHLCDNNHVITPKAQLESHHPKHRQGKKPNLTSSKPTIPRLTSTKPAPFQSPLPGKPFIKKNSFKHEPTSISPIPKLGRPHVPKGIELLHD